MSVRIPHISGNTPRAVSDAEATFADFLYGIGAPPAERGAPRHYTKRPDGLFQQQFDDGTTLANVGRRPVQVALEGRYARKDGTVCSAVVVEPGSAEVLHRVG